MTRNILKSEAAVKLAYTFSWNSRGVAVPHKLNRTSARLLPALEACITGQLIPRTENKSSSVGTALAKAYGRGNSIPRIYGN